ncbi:MAG: hypothetical protein HY720_31320 [Planctomycetes bacterium]|nr:hypothetical protein [Planctomycetota bacterium]
MNPPRRTLLGQLAVREGVLDETRLNECLALQARLAALGFEMRLGRILIEKHYLDRAALAALLELQAREAGDPSLPSSASRSMRFSQEERQAIAEGIRRRRLLRATDADRCRNVQAELARSGVRRHWAELVFEMGILPPEVAREILSARPRLTAAPESAAELLSSVRARAAPGSDAQSTIRVERLAVEGRFVPEGKVHECVAIQFLLRELGLRLSVGEILVRRGLLSETDHRRLQTLREQKISRLRFTDVARRTVEAPREDSALARLLVTENVLSVERVQECLYVQKKMGELGLVRPLHRILADKGYLGRREIDELRLRALAPGTPAPADIHRAASDTGRFSADLLGEEAERPAARVRLGELATFNRILTEAQVGECIEIQGELANDGLRLHLGQIFLLKHYVDRANLAALLRAQSEANRTPIEKVDVLKLSPAEHETLLARVRERGLLSPEKEAECARIHTVLGRRGIDLDLGDVYLLRGDVPRDLLRDLVERRSGQWRRGSGLEREETLPDPAEGLFREGAATLRAAEERIASGVRARVRRFRLGQLAVFEGRAKERQVRECLAIQMRLQELGVSWRLGETLVEKGYLLPADVDSLLALQRRNLSRIDWTDLAGEEALSGEDQEFARLLIDREILTTDEVRECCYVQRLLRELGMGEPLADVIADRELLDREVVDPLRRSLAREPESRPSGREAGQGDVLRSKALRAAYQEILSHARYRFIETARVERKELAAALRCQDGPTLRATIPRRRIPARFWAAPAGIGFLVVAGALWATPPLLESQPLPPEPARAAGPPLALPSGVPEETIEVEGTVHEFAVYPPGPGSERGTYDFLLGSSGLWYVVRGVIEPRSPAVTRKLQDLERSGAQIAVRGTLLRDAKGPLAPLPDGTWTHEYIEIESWTRAGGGE